MAIFSINALCASSHGVRDFRWLPVEWHVTLVAMQLLHLPLLCTKCLWSSLVMPILNNDQRNRDIGMLLAGTDVDQVAGAFGVHRTTISRLGDKSANTCSVRDKPRPGEPRKTTVQDDHNIILRVLQNGKFTARKLQ